MDIEDNHWWLKCWCVIGLTLIPDGTPSLNPAYPITAGCPIHDPIENVLPVGAVKKENPENECGSENLSKDN